MSKQSLNRRTPSPSDPDYIHVDTYQFLMDILRPTSVNYKSPQADFIRNEVLAEIKRVIKACILPKD